MRIIINNNNTCIVGFSSFISLLPCLRGRVGLRGAFGTHDALDGRHPQAANQDSSSSMLGTPTMPGASLDGGYKVYRARWYVLFAFSLVSLLQSMIWLTYSPVAETTKRYYGLCKTDAECKSENGPGQSTVDLFLNWGPIMYLLTVFPTMWLATRKNALRRIVLLSVFLETAAVALRALPTLIFTPDQGNPPPWYMIPCVHLGQICNAAVGPLVMATCTLLSASWFPAHERGTATSIAVVANNIGSFTGFFGAFVVNDSVHNLPRLLWIHFGIVMVALVLVLAYFPAKPPTPPSSSSVARRNSWNRTKMRPSCFSTIREKRSRCPVSCGLPLLVGLSTAYTTYGVAV